MKLAALFFFSAVALRAADAKGNNKKVVAKKQDSTPPRSAVDEEESAAGLRKLHVELGCCSWDESDLYCGTGGHKTHLHHCPHGAIFEPLYSLLVDHCPPRGPQGCCYTPWGGDHVNGGGGGCSDDNACWCGLSQYNCGTCGGCYCEYPSVGGVTRQEYEACIEHCQEPTPPEEEGCCYQPWAGVMGMGGCSHADWCNKNEHNCEGTSEHDPGCDGCWCPPGTHPAVCEATCASTGPGPEPGCCYQAWGGHDGNGGCSSADSCNADEHTCLTCDGCWCPPGTDPAHCEAICAPPPSTPHPGTTPHPPTTAHPPSPPGCCYWEEVGQFCTGGAAGYTAETCHIAGGTFNPNVINAPGSWHHGSCVPDEKPGTCYDRSHCHWHGDHWICNEWHSNEKPCWCSIDHVNCQGGYDDWGNYVGVGCDGIWVPNHP